MLFQTRPDHLGKVRLPLRRGTSISILTKGCSFSVAPQVWVKEVKALPQEHEWCQCYSRSEGSLMQLKPLNFLYIFMACHILLPKSLMRVCRGCAAILTLCYTSKKIIVFRLFVTY